MGFSSGQSPQPSAPQPNVQPPMQGMPSPSSNMLPMQGMISQPGQNPLAMSGMASPTVRDSIFGQLPFAGMFSAFLGPKLDQFLIDRGMAQRPTPVAPLPQSTQSGPRPELQALMARIPMYQQMQQGAPQQLPPRLRERTARLPPPSGLLGG